MKNKILLPALLILGILFLSAYKLTQQDLGKYIERYNTKFGDPCEKCTYSKDIFKAYYRNTSRQNLDVLISLQNTRKKWECFYFENVKPNDTMFVYVCKGTGRTLKWVKKAGDKEIVFPTCEEVNQMYKK
jgi:hypothetical protein